MLLPSSLKTSQRRIKLLQSDSTMCCNTVKYIDKTNYFRAACYSRSVIAKKFFFEFLQNKKYFCCEAHTANKQTFQHNLYLWVYVCTPYCTKLH